MRISRKHNFQNGKKANAHEVNAEFDQILNVLNGNIDAENLKNSTITKAKLNFFVSSNWRDTVETLEELETMDKEHMGIYLVEEEMVVYCWNNTTHTLVKIAGAVPTPSHKELTDRNEPDQHAIGSITGLSTKLAVLNDKVVIATDNVNSFRLEYNEKIAQLDEGLAELENIGAEVNSFRVELNSMDSLVDTNKLDIAALKASVAVHETTINNSASRISTLETDNTANKSIISGLQTSVSGLETEISEKYNKVGGILTGNVEVSKPVPTFTFDAKRTTKASVFWNANATGDYGFIIDSGGMRLNFMNTSKQLRFTRDNNTYYEVLDKGNTPPPAWETVHVISAFSAITTATTLASNGAWTTLPFNTEKYDNKGEYNPSTGEFVVGQPGIYTFEAGVRFEALSSGTEVKLAIRVNGSLARILSTEKSAGGDYTAFGSATMKLVAGDKVSVSYNHSAASAQIYNTGYDTYFSGIRLV